MYSLKRKGLEGGERDKAKEELIANAIMHCILFRDCLRNTFEALMRESSIYNSFPFPTYPADRRSTSGTKSMNVGFKAPATTMQKAHPQPWSQVLA